MPSIKSMLFGSGDKITQSPTKTPGQMSALDQLLSAFSQMGGQGGGYGQAMDYFKNLLSGGPEAFSQYEAPYRQQFEQETIPGIAERFAGHDAMGGGLMSSGFGQALGGAGAQLQAQLAALHGGLQQNAAGQMMGQYNQLANQGLGTQTFENIYQPGSTGLVGGIAQGIGSGAGLMGGWGMMQNLMRSMGMGGGGMSPDKKPGGRNG